MTITEAAVGIVGLAGIAGGAILVWALRVRGAARRPSAGSVLLAVAFTGVAVAMITTIATQCFEIRRARKQDWKEFYERCSQSVMGDRTDRLTELCRQVDTPFGDVALAGLRVVNHPKETSAAIETARVRQIERLSNVPNGLSRLGIVALALLTLMTLRRTRPSADGVGVEGRKYRPMKVGLIVLCTALVLDMTLEHELVAARNDVNKFSADFAALLTRSYRQPGCD